MAHAHVAELSCIQPGCNQNPTSHSLRKTMSFATCFNFTMGAFELFVGQVSGSASTLGSGMRGVTSTVAHAANTATLGAEGRSSGVEPGDRRGAKKYRILAATAIAAGAVYTGYNAAGYLSKPDTRVIQYLPLGTETAALAVGAGMVHRLRGQNDGSMAHKDTVRHVVTDTFMSGASMITIMFNPMFPDAQGYSGLASGGVCMYLAYKTATGNL